MKALTYAPYKESCDLYTEIHDSIAVNSCQIGIAQKDIILLSRVSIIVYKAGKRTGVENTKFINFNLSTGQLYVTVNLTMRPWCAPSGDISIHQKHPWYLAIEVYKSLAKLNPGFMWNFFERNHTPYNLRRGDLLLLPPAKSIRYGVNSLAFQGSLLWNNLPS